MAAAAGIEDSLIISALCKDPERKTVESVPEVSSDWVTLPEMGYGFPSFVHCRCCCGDCIRSLYVV